MSSDGPCPTGRALGAVLAGGRGRRIGGDKALVELGGRPLVTYAVEALRAVTDEIAVIAKRDTALPPLAGVEVVIEPDEPHHPLTGILTALRHAGARRTLVLAADMPFVTSDLLRRLLDAEARAAVFGDARGLQPFPAVLGAEARPSLTAAAERSGRLVDALDALGPRILPIPADPDALRGVNTPEDLPRAAAILSRRSPTCCAPAGRSPAPRPGA